MNQAVFEKIQAYPDNVKIKLTYLRSLVFSVATESENIGDVSESLKWGVPSFSTSSGSPVRIDWKASNPNYVGLYFHCGTKLVGTFRELYDDVFLFEGNRALLLRLSDDTPEEELKECILMALTYHQIKQLPLLGR